MTHLTLYDVNSKFSNILVELRQQSEKFPNKWLTTNLEIIPKWGNSWRILSSICSLRTNYHLSHVNTANVAESIYQRCEFYSQNRLLTAVGRQDALSILDQLDLLSHCHHSETIKAKKQKIQFLDLQSSDPQHAVDSLQTVVNEFQENSKYLDTRLKTLPKDVYSGWKARVGSFLTFFIPGYDYFKNIRCNYVAQSLLKECAFLSRQYLFSTQCKEKALEIITLLKQKTHGKHEKVLHVFEQKISQIKVLYETPQEIKQHFKVLAEALSVDRNKWLNAELKVIPRWSFAAYYYKSNISYENVSVQNVAQEVLRECQACSEQKLLSNKGKKHALRIVAELAQRKGNALLLKNIQDSIAACKVIEKVPPEQSATGKPLAVVGAPPPSIPAAPLPPPPPPAPRLPLASSLSKPKVSKYLLKKLPRTVKLSTWWPSYEGFKNVAAVFSTIKQCINTLIKESKSKAEPSPQCVVEYLDLSGYSNPVKNRFVVWLLEGSSYSENVKYTLKEFIIDKLALQFHKLTQIALIHLKFFWFHSPHKSLNDFIIEEVEKNHAKKFRALLVTELQKNTNFEIETINALWFGKEKSPKEFISKAKKDAHVLICALRNELASDMLLEGGENSPKYIIENLIRKFMEDESAFKANFKEEDRQKVFKTFLALATSQTVRNKYNLIFENTVKMKEVLEIERKLYHNPVAELELVEEIDLKLVEEIYLKYGTETFFQKCLQGIMQSYTSYILSSLTEKLVKKTGLSKDEVEYLWFEKEEVFERTKFSNPIAENTMMEFLSLQEAEIKSELFDIIYAIFSPYRELYKYLFDVNLPSIEHSIFMLVLYETVRNQFKSSLPKFANHPIQEKFLKKLFNEPENEPEYDELKLKDILDKYFNDNYFIHLYKTAMDKVKLYFSQKINSISQSLDYQKECDKKIKHYENEYKAKVQLRNKKFLTYYLKIPEECATEILAEEQKYPLCTLLSEYSPEHGVLLHQLKLKIIEKHFQEEFPEIEKNVAKTLLMQSAEDVALDKFTVEERSLPFSQIILNDNGNEELERFAVEKPWLELVEAELFIELDDVFKSLETDPEERERYVKGLWYSLKGMKTDAIARALSIEPKQAEKYTFYK